MCFISDTPNTFVTVHSTQQLGMLWYDTDYQHQQVSAIGSLTETPINSY